MTMVLGLALPLILVADGERIDRPTSFGTQILYWLRHLDLREKILLTKPVQPEVIADVFSVDAARTETALRSIERLDLRNRSLRGINFDRAVIPKADLRSADLQRANMQWAKLLDADLTHAKLQGANLENAGLASARAWFAEFQGANLRFADLEGAHLSFAKFEGSYLRYAFLQGAQLDHARLQGADLRGAKLQGVNLRNAKLQGANLEEVNLQHANLRGATLYTKVMNGAKVDLVDTRDLAWQPLTRDEHAWLFWKQSHWTWASVQEWASVPAGLDPRLEIIDLQAQFKERIQDAAADSLSPPKIGSCLRNTSTQVPCKRTLSLDEFRRLLLPELERLACESAGIARGLLFRYGYDSGHPQDSATAGLALRLQARLRKAASDGLCPGLASLTAEDKAYLANLAHRENTEQGGPQRRSTGVPAKH